MTDDALKSALDEARILLAPPAKPREAVWPPLAAAAFFAVSALTFAFASLLTPPVDSHSAPVPLNSSQVLRGVN